MCACTKHRSSPDFAKSDDLSYFLRQLCAIDYAHEPSLAPTEDIMTAFKKERGDWTVFQRDFLDLMAERRVESRFKAE